ncbi:PREDICTED: uncharacterized protein LOC101623656 [Condylura cristata]|uniref:uncharacterized protein LOC101623656 n=1 Tax=Condylura cristata TaxID=143302 RepID=UPI00064297B5|nr:PREDICTED: uncharacterized protein LOC101623656 [Condylura cristata]
MLLFWGPLLCWGLLPPAQGDAQHPLCLRISMHQLRTNISDLLAEHQVLERMIKVPLTGEGTGVLDHLPYVSTGLAKKSSGLDLSLVGDLLSGRSLPVLGKLLQVGGLIIEDARGPEVTLKVLSDSLLQVTFRCKLYLSLRGILRLKVLKNIRAGVRVEQMGSEPQVALEECQTPPGYLSITVLEKTDTLPAYLGNSVLQLVTDFLDGVLPFLLQKMVCPPVSTLLTLLLGDLLHIPLSPTISGQEGFQYYVTTTRFTEEAVVMEGQLVTPCGPGQRAPVPDHLDSRSLPTLAQGSMADLAFRPETYNGILSCLHKSKEIHVDPQDSMAAALIQLLAQRELESSAKASNQSRGHVELTICTPDAPTIHPEGDAAKVIQEGFLVLSGSSHTLVSIPWTLLSKAKFISRNHKLTLQFTPYSCHNLKVFFFSSSTKITLGAYPGVAKQDARLEALVSELLQGKFCPHYNEVLKEQDLPLPKIKGISFKRAQVELSKWDEPKKRLLGVGG